jgi:hypothetical protein
MFGSIDKRKGLLFVTYDLGLSIQNTQKKMEDEILALDGNRLLNTPVADLVAYFVEMHKIEPLTLLTDQWYAQAAECRVDVSNDPLRWIDESKKPFLMAGERTDVHVPFLGESELFYSRANTYSMNPPRAVIQNNELILRYEFPADATREVRPLVDHSLKEIEQHIAWQRPMIDAHNAALPGQAKQSIENRRSRLLGQATRAEALGIPVRRREGAPNTYAIPTVRKQATPTLPPVTPVEFKPEPVWAMEHYEQALGIMQNMALVMERSPEAFKSMDEEALRTHFLMQLNGQFEGNATAETFNMSGKTDILLREGDRNAFIAECKFWKGPKAFTDAIDQLLGYATWRDGKTVILVFNRGTDTSTVLLGIDTTVKAHGNFKRTVTWSHDSGFRYILRSTNDAKRELILTVLAFHVPK